MGFLCYYKRNCSVFKIEFSFLYFPYSITVEDTTLVGGSHTTNNSKVDATLVGKNVEDRTVVANKNGATAVPPIPVSRKIPHVSMIPEDGSPFGRVEKDVNGILKFGRLLPNTQDDQDFIGFPTRVVNNFISIFG